jgi:stringent starvation protein B
MNLTKPHKHLIPAIHAWLSENTRRIHIHIIGNYDGVVLHGVAGKTFDTIVAGDGDDKIINAKFEIITLSIGYEATNKLKFEEEGVSFQTRFNGKVQDVFVPYLAIKTMNSPDLDLGGPGFTTNFEAEDLKYAKDSGYKSEQAIAVSNEQTAKPQKVSHLKVVK